ncbi:MAG: N-6 DNA methylase [Butyrivibrio sp.]|nr:N-6 DNA methylase [Butyrivibrio sp.]
MKLGKLIPEKLEGGVPYFSANYVAGLKAEISSGKNSALKSRRNKRFISGNGIYNSYVSDGCTGKREVDRLLGLLREEEISLTLEVIGWIVGFYAEKLLGDGRYSSLVDDLVSDRDKAMAFAKLHPNLFDLDLIYEEKEDILGLIYISCKNLGSRKAKGSYYTPSAIVKRVTAPDILNLTGDSRVLDPCCGTGNFLLQLPEGTEFENVYGCDIDSVSVCITRINMALRFPEADPEMIRAHITERDYLLWQSPMRFTHIIGNPPWGYEFTDNEKQALKQLYRTASATSFDSFDVFTQKALLDLKEGGELTFVLPKSILNVRVHEPIRRLLLEKTSIERIEYLGDAFHKVNCPSIIMKIRNTGKELSTKGLVIDDGTRSFTIENDRTVDAGNFSFLSTDEEYRVIEKIRNVRAGRFLLNNADFALGIVTGSNSEYISGEKSSDNEMVLRGSDIFKYRYRQADSYITFKPDSFQQVAPEYLYRAKEKLLYRFISSQLVFAYDDKQTLSLNSCNVLIPRIDGLDIKYIMAILNSGVAQFFYEKQFDSVKILRAHIESIPIPYVDSDIQKKVIEMVNRLIVAPQIESLYDDLDNLIFDIFGLTKDDIRIIRSATDGANRFLPI